MREKPKRNNRIGVQVLLVWTSCLLAQACGLTVQNSKNRQAWCWAGADVIRWRECSLAEAE